MSSRASVLGSLGAVLLVALVADAAACSSIPREPPDSLEVGLGGADAGSVRIDGGGLRDGGAADGGSVALGEGGLSSDATVPSPPAPLLGVQATTGWQIYPGGAYRYGPSIIVDGADTHVWTCSPGENGAWDFIRYRHSTDGGHTFTDDVVALQPTSGTRDALSTCDPGAVRIGAYWYLGYTSTQDSRGTNNQVYVARSTSPTGPFLKWDGAGWGGAPQPIVTYSADPQFYGAGEPSLVLVGSELRVYSTYDDGVGHTDLAIAADATKDDWPTTLQPKGHVITRRAGEDSTDIKFIDSAKRYIGVSTYNRFTPNSSLVVYDSADGLNFQPIAYRGARAQLGAHNAGISGDPSGHLLPAGNFVAYAYQPLANGWGNWPTFLDPVTIVNPSAGTPVAGLVSSIVGGSPGMWQWSGPYAWDGDPGTVFSSDSHGAVDAANEWLQVDLGTNATITGVTLTPRGGGLGFPVDFSIQSSSDGVNYMNVPGQVYGGYANPGSQPASFTFAVPVTARFLRVWATRLGADDSGNHYLQLAEIMPLVGP